MQMYEIKVQLLEVTPVVWRKIRVPADTRLSRVHRILQVVMGWTNSHIHLFDIHGVYYGEPSSDWGMKVLDHRKTTLEQIFSQGVKSFIYEYDMGDGWRHRISLLKTVEGEPKEKAACLSGARACPPEDCGGSYGYIQMLVALSDPDHEDHAMYRDWLGEPFDPNNFNLEDINWDLKRLR